MTPEINKIVESLTSAIERSIRTQLSQELAGGKPAKRPGKVVASGEAPRRRGRPPKAAVSAAAVAAGKTPENGYMAPSPTKKRGRPRKEVVAAPANGVADPAAPPAKKRGRPPKAKVEAAANGVAEIAAAPAKKRGRPPKSKTVATAEDANSPKVSKSVDRYKCPVPDCTGKAAPVFGMVCGTHKDLPKDQIQGYRNAARAS